MCDRTVKGNWDARYERTRVRSLTTGNMLSWGDGETYYDQTPKDALPGANGAMSARFVGTLTRARTTSLSSSNVGAGVSTTQPSFPPSRMHIASHRQLPVTGR